MTRSYTKDDIRHLAPMQAIQKRPTQYIPSLGVEGVIHLIKEIIQNSMDEMIIKNPVCDTIIVRWNEEEQTVTIIDNGRGIPPEAIHLIVTELHSGGKFDDEDDEDSAYSGFGSGMNGLGTAAVNALSDFMIITVRLNGKVYQAKYGKGELVEDLKVIDEYNKKEGTGTSVSFRPSNEFLEEYHVTCRDVMNLCKDLSYLIPAGDIIKFVGEPSGSNKTITKKFKHEKGLESRLDTILKEPVLNNNIKIHDISKNNTADIYFNFDLDDPDETLVSYANFCTTTDGGAHVNAFKYEVGRIIAKEVRKSMSAKQLKKIDVKPKDVRVGIKAIINANTKTPQFEGQGKRKIKNKDLYDYVREVIEDQLTMWIAKNMPDFNKVSKVVIANAKARQRDKQLRKLALKSPKGVRESFFSKDAVEKLEPAKGTENLELFLVEGDSALGTAVTVRDPNTQAFLPFRGYPLNTYGKNVLNILKNNEMKALVKTLGTGIGNNFDIDNLKYEKIIIMTDADIDGQKIFSLMSTFFICHMPQVVEEGRLFKAVPPLYKFKMNGKEQFVKGRREYYEVIEKIISKENVVKYNGTKLTDDEITDLLSANRHYIEVVSRVSKATGYHPVLIEYLSKYKDAKPKEIIKALDDRFDHVNTDNAQGFDYITAVCDGEYNTVILSERLYKNIELLSVELHGINKGKLIYNVNGVDMTLYEMLRAFESYEPKNLTRYKGLGEMNDDQLWETTLNPETRTLIQLTVDDLEDASEMVRKLHGSKAIERRNLVQSLNISMLDIDN